MREELFETETENGSKIVITKVIYYEQNAFTGHIPCYYYIYSCEELNGKDLNIVQNISGRWYTTYTGKGLSISEKYESNYWTSEIIKELKLKTPWKEIKKK